MITQLYGDTCEIGLTWGCNEGSEVCPMVADLVTSVWLRLHALGGLSLGDLASEEVITRIGLLNRGMKDCETGRVRVVKQLACNKLLIINLNDDAAYETGVEDGSFGEQSGKIEKNVRHL